MFLYSLQAERGNPTFTAHVADVGIHKEKGHSKDKVAVLLEIPGGDSFRNRGRPFDAKVKSDTNKSVRGTVPVMSLQRSLSKKLISNSWMLIEMKRLRHPSK